MVFSFSYNMIQTTESLYTEKFPCVKRTDLLQSVFDDFSCKTELQELLFSFTISFFTLNICIRFVLCACLADKAYLQVLHEYNT